MNLNPTFGMVIMCIGLAGSGSINFRKDEIKLSILLVETSPSFIPQSFSISNSLSKETYGCRAKYSKMSNSLAVNEPGMEVVGIAIRVEGLAAQLEASRPDVVILDWNLATQPETDFFLDLRSRVPRLKIVVLDIHPEKKQAVESAGADVFISKDMPPDRLLMMLRNMRKDELANLH